MVLTGLEACVLTCNVMQVIEISWKTTKLVKDLYDGRKPDEDVNEIARLMVQASSQAQAFFPTSVSNNTDEQSLIDREVQCREAAQTIESLLTIINNPQSEGNLLRSVQMAVKTAEKEGTGKTGEDPQ